MKLQLIAFTAVVLQSAIPGALSAEVSSPSRSRSSLGALCIDRFLHHLLCTLSHTHTSIVFRPIIVMRLQPRLRAPSGLKPKKDVSMLISTADAAVAVTADYEEEKARSGALSTAEVSSSSRSSPGAFYIDCFLHHLLCTLSLALTPLLSSAPSHHTAYCLFSPAFVLPLDSSPRKMFRCLFPQLMRRLWLLLIMRKKRLALMELSPPR